MQNLGNNEKTSRRHLTFVLCALRFYDSRINTVLSDQLEFLDEDRYAKLLLLR